MRRSSVSASRASSSSASRGRSLSASGIGCVSMSRASPSCESCNHTSESLFGVLVQRQLLVCLPSQLHSSSSTSDYISFCPSFFFGSPHQALHIRLSQQRASLAHAARSTARDGGAPRTLMLRPVALEGNTGRVAKPARAILWT
ncbi:hypothetical protein C8J57DRAFT_1544257 [Mycena rebaudengoi]|nr:hypothetical protein C8J57DRAFT_1544257 [Mycena rebaudengoi]